VPTTTVGNDGNDATGTMAMSGETRTENSGTRAVRSVSPLKMLPVANSTGTS
jgi:hypothetical protein